MSEPSAFEKMADKFEGGVTICNVRFSKQVDQLIPALVKARKNFGEIHKDAVVKVKTDKGGFSFRYATLPEIMNAVDGPLLDAGIYLTQHGRPTERQLIVSTLLVHESGQYMASEYAVPIKNPGDQKEVGIATTYCRRYSISGILGIAADEDTDASTSFNGKVEHQQKQVPSGPPDYYGKLKKELKAAGVEDGDKDLADQLLQYVTRHTDGGMVNLSMAYRQPEVCKRAIAAVASARKDWPADSEQSLVDAVRESLAEGPKA